MKIIYFKINSLKSIREYDDRFEMIFLMTCFQYQQWINNERIHLHKRIEMLENENHQLSDLYFTYQVQNEKSLAAIINLILQILSTQQVNLTISLAYDNCRMNLIIYTFRVV